MKNYLLTLLIGLLAGMEIARWLERTAPAVIPATTSERIPSTKTLTPAISPISEANFEEPWVQALYAAQLTEKATALSHLRHSQTNEAIALLETSLDADLKKAGEYILTMKKAPSDANLLIAVRLANAYRMEFSHTPSPLKP